MNTHIEAAIASLYAEVRVLEAIRPSDPEEAADVQAAIGNLRTAMNEITTREAARAEVARKAARRKELQPLCRAARDKVTKIDREFLASEKAIVRAQDNMDNAERHLIDARNAALPPYPTETEISSRQKIVEQLEEALEKARANLRDVKTNHERIRREGLAARDDFNRLAFEERQCQPLDKSQPQQFRVMSIG